MSTSKLYSFQEWLEARVSEALPEGVPVISRRKGNIDPDIENALAAVGIAVVVKPPLPLEWSDSCLLSCAKVESEIHILENVLLQETQETAYSILERIAAALYQAQCGEPAASILKLESVRDESPSDEAVIRFVLPVTNSLNL